MTISKASFTDVRDRSKESKSILLLLFVLLALIPFQRRFHGCIDSFSRRLALPDFPIPEFFSTKVHLFIADPLILILTLVLLFRFKVSLRLFFWTGASKYLTLLFFVSLASLYFSITSHYSLQYFRLLQFSMAFLLFYSICSSRCQIDFSLFIRRLAWLLICISCLECLISVYQYFCQESIGLQFLGEPNMRHFPFVNPGKHRWLFDKILSPAQSSDFLCRAMGTFPHPNILGGFLFCSLMASLYLWMKEEHRSRQMFLLGTILLQVFTLYIAYSRSAFLALGLSALFWCVLQFKAIVRQYGLHFLALRRLAIVSAALLTSGLIGIGLFFSQMSARGGIFNYNAVTQFADSERVQYLKMAFNMIQEHPLLGVGFNNFQLCSDPIQAACPGHIFFSKVHNIYLLVAAETGLIGGGLFLLFLISILKTAWHSLKTPTDSQEKIFLLSVFLGFLLIGACDFYFLHTQHGRILFFGFSALLYALVSNKNSAVLTNNED